MNCKYCGTELPEGAAFCTECGKKTGNTAIRLRCSECGAPLHPEGKGKTLVCPYCGSRKILKENDGLIRSQLRARRAREYLREQQKQEEKRLQRAENAERDRLKNEEKQKQQAEAAERERQRNEERQKQRTLILARNQRKQEEKYRQKHLGEARRKEFAGNGMAIAIVATFAFTLAIFAAALNYKDRAAVVAAIQVGLMVVAVLMGIQKIPTKYAKTWIAPTMVAFMLAMPYFAFWTASEATPPRHDPWPTEGIAAYLPVPESTGKECRVYLFSTEELNIQIKTEDSTAILKYIEQCKEAGFTVDPFDRNSTYKAFNEDEYELEVKYESLIDIMQIHLTAPVELSEITWRDYSPYTLVPKPEFSEGRIESERGDRLEVIVNDYDRNAFNAYVDQCLKAGYDKDYSRNIDVFNGESENGFKLQVEYLGLDRMSILVYEPYKRSW